MSEPNTATKGNDCSKGRKIWKATPSQPFQNYVENNLEQQVRNTFKDCLSKGLLSPPEPRFCPSLANHDKRVLNFAHLSTDERLSDDESLHDDDEERTGFSTDRETFPCLSGHGLFRPRCWRLRRSFQHHHCVNPNAKEPCDPVAEQGFCKYSLNGKNACSASASSCPEVKAAAPQLFSFIRWIFITTGRLNAAP